VRTAARGRALQPIISFGWLPLPCGKNDQPLASVAAATQFQNGCWFTKERDMSPKDRTVKAMVDEKLDQALRDSFPASDPVSFIEPVPVWEGDRKLTVVEAAKRMRKRKATRS
jgi:hypothetical protein